MLKVGITGGIGSGKSVVCQLFTILGVPVFNADKAARYLMNNDQELKAAISALLGNSVYEKDAIDRKRVSDAIFRSPELLSALNALVHPATIAYAQRWMMQQQAHYIIKEAAIFFESGSHKEMDLMIGVYAPLELRVSRAVRRGGISEHRVREIIAQQMDENEKMSLCNFVITNDDATAVIPQVLHLHQQLMAS